MSYIDWMSHLVLEQKYCLCISLREEKSFLMFIDLMLSVFTSHAAKADRIMSRLF